MKKNLVKSALVLSAMAGLLALVGCDTPVDDPKVYNLGTPTNVEITVVDRLFTVTWDAVPNVQGYEITTTSTGCGSGNKLINTKANTATNLEGEGTYLKDDGSNGAVVIKNAITIEITLMPAMGDNTKPMASAVSAKVKALGGEAGKKKYLDSEYSSEATKILSGGMGGM